MNNAGRPGPARRTLSADGHEATFQTNYLALVALTSALLRTLASADHARVVNVTSRTHLSATLKLDDLELERDYNAVGELLHAMFGAGGAPAETGAASIVDLVRRPGGVNGQYFDENRRADVNPGGARDRQPRAPARGDDKDARVGRPPGAERRMSTRPTARRYGARSSPGGTRARQLPASLRRR